MLGEGAREWSFIVPPEYEDADRWDLEFWQARTPQERLSALVDIHEDIARVRGRCRVLRRVKKLRQGRS
ncbi:MAG: hypothetical protein NTX40_08770 [Planctomycetota bacterium]|nr:hypothetical protein [Planctomycetota bacterium]